MVNFHLLITLAYVIPNIYVFFRINSLFVDKSYRWWYVIIYLMVFAIYPLTENIDDSRLPGFILFITEYILPFYLYVFLAVLVFDIFLLFNLFIRVIKRETLKSRKFKLQGLASVIIISLAVVTGGVINLNTIRVSDYSITIPKKDSKLENLRIAFIADFHLKDKTNLNVVRKFAGKLNEIKPDIVLLGGDILERSGPERNKAEIESLFRNIDTRYGMYAVLGNHDVREGESDFFENSGIGVIKDTVHVIDNAFNLLGRYDNRYDRKTIESLMTLRDAELPVIMLDHRPTDIEQASHHEIDIQLMGHTHNGQLFPINFIIRQLYVLTWGYKKIRNSHFFVTSGIQLWGPPVKTTGVSEIMVIDVVFR